MKREWVFTNGNFIRTDPGTLLGQYRSDQWPVRWDFLPTNFGNDGRRSFVRIVFINVFSRSLDRLRDAGRNCVRSLLGGGTIPTVPIDEVHWDFADRTDFDGVTTRRDGLGRGVTLP